MWKNCVSFIENGRNRAELLSLTSLISHCFKSKCVPQVCVLLCNSPNVKHVLIQSRWDLFYDHARAMCISDLLSVHASALRLVSLGRVWYISWRPAGRTPPIPSAFLPCLSVPPPLPSPPLHATTLYCRLTPTLFAPPVLPRPRFPPAAIRFHRTSSQLIMYLVVQFLFVWDIAFSFLMRLSLVLTISFARSL